MKLIMFLFVLMFISPVYAAEDDKMATCEDWEALAVNIMSARQNGVQMSKMMGILKSEDDKTVKMLIIEAYDSPKYSGEKYKKESISEFSNKVFLDCTRVKSK